MIAKANRYTVVFRANGKTLMHSCGRDREQMIVSLLSLLEHENVSTQADLMDNETNEVIFSSRKTAI